MMRLNGVRHRIVYKCWWCVLVIGVGGFLTLVTLGVSTQGMSAEAPSDSIEAIDQIRSDVDGDAVPDRVGDTVTVAGRTYSGQGEFMLSGAFFVQDQTGGVAVRFSSEMSVGRGDSLHIRGVVEHENGLTQIEGLDYTAIDVQTRSPSPLPLTVAASQQEEYEGQLVQVQGRVIRVSSNEEGRHLLLAEQDEPTPPHLAVFVPHHHLQQIPLHQIEEGDQVEVTGALAQYDRSLPYTNYYQIWPRDENDLAQIGVVSPYLHTGIIVVIGVGLLVLLSLLTLRASVKRRTQELTESQARFQRLAEATFEGIIIHDEGTIVDTNTALVQMIGHDRDDLIGGDVVDIFSENTCHLIQQDQSEEKQSPYEAVVVRTDGTTIPVDVEEKRVTVEDRNVGVVALRDITERKRRETEILLAKREAEEMARLKSSLLNNMSHELRTPITSIIGYAELIINEPDGPHETFAERIRRSGERLSETLRAVLEMAQIEAGTLDLQASTVNVDVLAQEVVDSYAEMTDGESLQVKVEASEACTLETDGTLVYRILSNLVHNAIKFTEEGSVRVFVEPAVPGVQIRVQDTGIGIDEDFQSQLFDPFTQESEGRAREYEGIGLGLALTQRMVGLLGGTITVESAKGEGSTFVVMIPPLVGERQPMATAVKEGASGSFPSFD